jgi:hypothetical protein
MPAKNFLKIDQKEKLRKALKENEHPDIRERILVSVQGGIIFA